MTPADFKSRCIAIGLTNNTMIANAMHRKDRVTIRRWLSGYTPIPHWVEAQLSEIERQHKASRPFQKRTATNV